MSIVIETALRAGSFSTLRTALLTAERSMLKRRATSLPEIFSPCVAIWLTRALRLNIASTELAEATDYCGTVSGKKVDKSGVFDTFYGKLETAPMITGSVPSIFARGSFHPVLQAI